MRARKSPVECLRPGQPLTLAGVADGAEALVIADLARAVAAQAEAPTPRLLVICQDGPRMAQLSSGLGFFAPELEVLEFPSWDCLPYDRASPHPAICAQRMVALARLAHPKRGKPPDVLLS